MEVLSSVQEHLSPLGLALENIDHTMMIKRRARMIPMLVMSHFLRLEVRNDALETISERRFRRDLRNYAPRHGNIGHEEEQQDNTEDDTHDIYRVVE